MRVLLGWLLLFGLAAFAGWGTARWRARARAMGESVTRVHDPEIFGAPARVLIGAPSGADPVGRAQAPVQTPPTELGTQTPAPIPDTTRRTPSAAELTVRPGSTLSQICQEFYADVERPPLSQVVEAVSEWNGLASPNDLRAGQRLLLPSIGELFP